MPGERLERGRALLATLDPGNEDRLRQAFQGVAPDMLNYVLEYPFGDVYSRPGLDLRSRMLVTLSAVATLGYAQPQLKAHVKNALNIGLTREEIAEVFIQLSVYAGFPAALNALASAKEVFRQMDANPSAED